MMLITLSVKPTGEKKDYAEVGVRSQKKFGTTINETTFYSCWTIHTLHGVSFPSQIELFIV